MQAGTYQRIRELLRSRSLTGSASRRGGEDRRGVDYEATAITYGS